MKMPIEDLQHYSEPSMETKIDALRECPFCGGESFTQEFEPHKHMIDFMPDHPGSGSIECKNCSCGILATSVKSAIKEWNTRASDEVIRCLVEALGNITNMAIACNWENYTTGRQLLLDDAEKALAQAREYLGE